MAEAYKALLMISALFALGVYLLATTENRYQSFRKAAKEGLLFPSSNNEHYRNRGNKTAIINTIKLVGWLFVLIPIVVLILGFSRGGIFWQHFLR
jgi:hypothetical protein